MDISLIALGLAVIFLVAALVKWISDAAARRRMKNHAAAVASGGTEDEPVKISDPFHDQPVAPVTVAPAPEEKTPGEETEKTESEPESPYIWE